MQWLSWFSKLLSFQLKSTNQTHSNTLTGGNPDSNTLISDMTTVICLDDFHSLDRNGRSREKVTALDPKAQNFQLMCDQVRLFG